MGSSYVSLFCLIKYTADMYSVKIDLKIDSDARFGTVRITTVAYRMYFI